MKIHNNSCPLPIARNSQTPSSRRRYRQLVAGSRELLLPTTPQQLPSPPDSQAPAETSSRKTSVGRSGSAATSRAPRYKERETQKSSRQTRTPAAATATA